MICLRCGCCCTNLDVAIVNPKFIRADGTIDLALPGSMIFKPCGRKCPHLAYVKSDAVCTIHDLPCYKGTPCQQFEQFGQVDDVCTLASYYKGIKGKYSV